jgi:AraC family transcriptional regulator
LRRPRLWIGGVVGRHAQHLARLWLGAAQPQRFAVSEAFLAQAMRAPQQRPAPRWLDDFDAGLDADEPAPSTAALAKRFDLTTSWIARAYRHWRGEGMGEALRRRRVERAAVLFETRDAGLADIALDAGFCDQSHMNRAFKRILGRTPAAVRAARLGLAGSQPRFASGRPMG